MSDIEQVEALPVTAITVNTVSVPVVVVPAEPVTVDLRPSARLGGASSRPATPVASTTHTALWWTNIQSPVLPRMSMGWRVVVLLTVTGAVGALALMAGMVAWLGGWF